jgi:hypothetical protein
MTPPNVVNLHLDGLPLYALDQAGMLRLRLASDRTGVPITQLIRDALDRTVAGWRAEADLPKKIVSFPSPVSSIAC